MHPTLNQKHLTTFNAYRPRIEYAQLVLHPHPVLLVNVPQNGVELQASILAQLELDALMIRHREESPTITRVNSLDYLGLAPQLVPRPSASDVFPHEDVWL